VRQGRVHDAYALVQSFPPDLRAVVKPFFTHFTAGRTTEMATAHAVADIAAALVGGEQRGPAGPGPAGGGVAGSARGRLRHGALQSL